MFAAEAVRACTLVRDAVSPERWPEARAVLDAALGDAAPPLATLPLAACAAAGGDMEAAIPGAAAWLALNLSLRIYDDVMDEDRPDALWATLGRARAVVVAAALREVATLLITHAPSAAELTIAALRDMSASLMHVGEGQDRDLAGAASDLASWWRVMELKSGALFALACRVGARLGGANSRALASLTRYGHAAGMALQLTDDWLSTAPSRGARDLATGKRSTPVWVALQIAPPDDRARLEAIVSASPPWDAREAGRILDECGARPYTLWLAHRMADRAGAALAGLSIGPSAHLIEYARAPLPPLPQAYAHLDDPFPWLSS